MRKIEDQDKIILLNENIVCFRSMETMLEFHIAQFFSTSNIVRKKAIQRKK